MITAADEQRHGEDRRETAVTHEVLHDLIMQHHGEIKVIKQDVHIIKEDMEPITQGVSTMVTLFKLLIGLGLIAGALVGINEAWEILGHMGEHTHE